MPALRRLDASSRQPVLAHGERRLSAFNVGDFRRHGHRMELTDV